MTSAASGRRPAAPGWAPGRPGRAPTRPRPSCRGSASSRARGGAPSRTPRSHAGTLTGTRRHSGAAALAYPRARGRTRHRLGRCAPARRHRQGRHGEDHGRGGARAGARGGRTHDVLLVEIEGRQGIAQLFDVPPLPYEERRVAVAPGGGDVYALAIDAEAALIEYLEMYYKLGRAAERCASSARSTSPRRSRPACATYCSPERRTRRPAADEGRGGRCTTPSCWTHRRPGGSRRSSTSTPRSPAWPRSGRCTIRPTPSCGCCSRRRPSSTWSRCSRRCRYRRRSTRSPSCGDRLPVGAVIVNLVREPAGPRADLTAARQRPSWTRSRTGLKSAGIDRPPGLVDGSSPSRGARRPGRPGSASARRDDRLRRPTYELPVLPRASTSAGCTSLAEVLRGRGRGMSPGAGHRRPPRRPGHRGSSCAAAPAGSARRRRQRRWRCAPPNAGRRRRRPHHRSGAAAGPVAGPDRAGQRAAAGAGVDGRPAASCTR